MSQSPVISPRKSVTVAVTGAAGQIGYALLPRIASGAVFGAHTQVHLRLLEIAPALDAVRGLILELEDCAFPTLASVCAFVDEEQAFDGADYVVLVGARPRKAGMERADLLRANAGIFAPQGRAINDCADRDVRVLVVGNPANTNALIVREHAPDVRAGHITALSRLDHNRGLAQLARRLKVTSNSISRFSIWGNHSTTQFPDTSSLVVDGMSETEVARQLDRTWLDDEFIPRVAQRGAQIIALRGASSAASAANAISDHLHDWEFGTRPGDWVSAGLPSTGDYDVPPGVVCSYPVVCRDREWQVVSGIELSSWAREKIDISIAELISERESVLELGLLN